MFTIAESIAAVQDYLRTNAALPFDDLKNKFMLDHGIKLKTDGQFLWLDYHQTNVKWREPYGYVCRGLILDPANDFAIVSFGLAKFFNAGEGFAATLDWNTTKAIEKLDGSMVQRYWNHLNNRFEYSTRFSPYEQLRVSSVSFYSKETWGSLIDKALVNSTADLSTQPKNETWVFEVRTPSNIVVVQAATYTATLIAIRNIQTLQETHVDRPEFQKFSSIEESNEFIKDWNGALREGLILIDDKFNRLKNKCPSYNALHRCTNAKSWPDFIRLAASNDYEELFNTHPHLMVPLKTSRAAIDAIGIRHQTFFAQISHLTDRKEFAQAVNANKEIIASILFFFYSKKTTDYNLAFENMHEKSFITHVLKELEKYNIDTTEESNEE